MAVNTSYLTTNECDECNVEFDPREAARKWRDAVERCERFVGWRDAAG